MARCILTSTLDNQSQPDVQLDMALWLVIERATHCCTVDFENTTGHDAVAGY